MEFSAFLQELKLLHKRHGKPFHMRAGGSPALLQELESVAGFPVDEHLQKAWRLADGSKRDTPIFVRPDFLTGYGFLSMKETRKLLEQWKTETFQGYDDYEDPEPRDPRIKAGWFRDKWLPFADFGNGTLLLLQDYDPAPSGTKGQIIAFTHDPDEMTYIAPDFPTFLEMVLASLNDEDFLEDFIEQDFW